MSDKRVQANGVFRRRRMANDVLQTLLCPMMNAALNGPADVLPSDVLPRPQANLEQAEEQIKRFEAFLTTMEANDEKLNGILQFAKRLTEEGHYAADKIQKKAENIAERRETNRYGHARPIGTHTARAASTDTAREPRDQ